MSGGLTAVAAQDGLAGINWDVIPVLQHHQRFGRTVGCLVNTVAMAVEITRRMDGNLSCDD